MNNQSFEKRLKKGLTLISLVVTIIVLLILSSIVVVSLKSNENIISRTEGTKEDSTKENIKEYVRATYAQVVTDPELANDSIDELASHINEDNETKKEKAKFFVKEVNIADKTITVEHQGVILEVDLSGYETGETGASDESIKGKLHAIAFDYFDTDDQITRKLIQVKDGTSIKAHLNANNDSIPSDRDWEPTLNENSPVKESRVYKEKTVGHLNMYTVSFDVAGGSPALPIMRVPEGSKIPTPPTVVKAHHQFVKWTPSIDVVIDRDTTFKAVWQENTYTFTFKLAGGNIGGSTNDVKYSGIYNTNSSKPANPTLEHHNFEGWTPAVPAKYDGNKTFTAKWEPKTYTFTFNLAGGNIGGSTTNKTTSGVYNTTSSKPADPTREHYTFNGWNPNVPAVYDGNKTFNALWSPLNYTYTYKMNGGNIGGSTSDVSYTGAYGTASKKPSNPVRSHYTFEGWDPAVPTAYEGNKTFTAKWKINTYTFTFKLNGGNIGGSTTDKTTSGNYNTNSTTPSNPVRTHYTFNGWSPTVPAKYDGNKTFTAQWTPITYTFTYKLDGGNIGGSTSDVKYNGTNEATAQKPSNPVKTHYTFNGWSPAVPSKYDGNKTFTAQWTPVTYTYTYNLASGNIGGSTANVTYSGPYGSASQKPANPVRTHYTFNGWSPTVASTYTGNRTYTATWTPVTYTYTYNLASGNIGGSTANVTYSGPYGTASQKPSNPVRTHYTFNGWSPTVASTYTGNRTYTAQWTPVTYTYTYNLASGNIGGSTANVTYSGAYGTTSQKPANPVRTHYTFNGWSPSVASTYTGNRTYTATWTPVTYTYTYNLASGNIGGSTANVTFSGAYGSTSQKPANPVRTHYTFNGWSPTVASTYTGNRTYTATWTPVTYTYTYNLASGNIGGSTANVTYSGPYGSTSQKPSNPVRTHYTFSGWSPTVASTYTGNRTYTATWTAVTYTYTYNLASGNIGGSTANVTYSGAYGTTSQKPANPVRTHYTFNGWSPSVASTYTGNRTYTATWTINTYTYTYNLAGGNIGGSTSNVTYSGTYGSTSSKPSNPVRTHYTFNGWSPTVASTYTGNRTYTATWTAVTYKFTYKMNGGNISGSTSDVSYTGAYASTSKKPSNPVRTNYDFAGWDPAVPSTFNGNKTFTATWTIKKYTITYNLAGGTYNSSTTNPTRQVEHNATPPNLTPTRSGYVFIEWTPAIVKATKNATYTAIWSLPMEIRMRKTSVGQQVVLPVTIPSGYKAYVSDAGSAYRTYTSTPKFTNTVAANTNFTVKIAGRLKKISYLGQPQAVCDQLYRIISWGEIMVEEYCFAREIDADPELPMQDQCRNLGGAIPTPSANSFINVETFEGLFKGAKKLTGSIPSNFFASAVNATDYYMIFYGCTGLDGTIPSNLFSASTKATTFSYSFFGMTQVTSIPANLFAKNTLATSFWCTFRNCTGITSIPATLFAKNTEVKNFYWTFRNCTKLKTIGTGLFDNCTKVTTFERAFYNCTSLTKIPAKLFDNCKKVTNFTSTFAYCTNLTGSAPNLWSRGSGYTKVAEHYTCFYQCNKLSNWSSIPDNWKLW